MHLGDIELADIGEGVTGILDAANKYGATGIKIYEATTKKSAPPQVVTIFSPPPPPGPAAPVQPIPLTPTGAVAPARGGVTGWIVGALAAGGVLVGGLYFLSGRRRR